MTTPLLKLYGNNTDGVNEKVESKKRTIIKDNETVKDDRPEARMLPRFDPL